MTEGPSNDNDSVRSGDRLFPLSRFCIHPTLRNKIESQDRAALFEAAQLLVDLGTPAERAAALREDDVSYHPEEGKEANESEDSGAWGKKLDGLPPLTLCYASPMSHYATLHDVDMELRRRCRYLLSIFDGCEGESSYIPADLQSRVVPLLYAWVVDWDFLLRNVTCWEVVARCFCRVAAPRRRRRSYVRPDFSLPWRPLTVVLRSLFFQPGRVMDLHAFHGMRKAAGDHLDRVCEVASQYFGPDALQGLWETFSPYFSPQCEEAALMLCLFSHLVPVHRLVDDEMNTPLPLTERIVQFLLVDSALWQQQSPNWMSYSLKIVFKMSLFHVGVVDWDKYAEPLFSMMLFEQRLPTGGSTETPRRQFSRDFGFLGNISLFRLERNETSMAMAFVVNMLPDRTDSPMWNQLRRFVPATSIFLRPHATDKHALHSVFAFYTNLVVAAFRRMKAQNAFLHQKSFPTRRVSSDFVRPIPDAHIWSPSTVHCFVDLIAPVVLSSLHHQLHNTPRALGFFTALAPAKMQKMILPYVDAGLCSSGESPQQRHVALRVLIKVLYPLCECRETRAECWAFVENVLSRVLLWMNTNDATLSLKVLDFIFTICTVVSLRRLLGGEDAECNFAVALVEKLFEFANHMHFSDPRHTDLSPVMLVLCMNVSEATLQRCVDSALREAEAQGTLSKAHAVARLLEPIARHAPSRVLLWALRVLVPPLQSAATTDGDVEWCAVLLAGCVRGAGLAAFAHRHALIECVQWQLAQVTRKERLKGAAKIYAALYAALSTTVCDDGRAIRRTAAARGPDGSNPTNAQDSEENEMESEDEEYENESEEAQEEGDEDVDSLRVGFCRGTSVHVSWREPDEAHMAFLVETYRQFLSDAMETIRCIDSVVATRSDRSSGADGLRTFFLSSGAVSPTNASVRSNAISAADSEHNEGDAVTPQNVLRGVLLWLSQVLLINQELRAQCEEEIEKTVNIMPWWGHNPRAVWPLPPVGRGVALPLSTDAIGDVLREYALRRVADGATERHSVATAALRRQFGDALLCDSHKDSNKVKDNNNNYNSNKVKKRDKDNDGEQEKDKQIARSEGDGTTPTVTVANNANESLSMSSSSSSQSERAEETDVRSLRALLWILADQCNVDVADGPRLTSHTERARAMDHFCQAPLVTLKGMHYLPAVRWRIKAESFVQARRSRALHAVPPRRLSQLLSLCYALLYSSHNAVRNLCTGVLQSCICLLGPADVRGFLTLHLNVLEHIAEIWSSTDNSAANSRNAESGAPAVVLCALRNSEDERAQSSRLKRELSSALSLALNGFCSPHFFYDDYIIQRTYALVLQFPEELMIKRIGGDHNISGNANRSGLSTMEHHRVARLTDALLNLASRFACAAPGRALGCLMMVVALYRPSHAALLSRQSVQSLFRLTVNVNTKVRETSFHILQCLLLSLKRAHPKAHILTRRGTVEAEGDVEFFRHRYETLRCSCASFYGVREVGMSFAPRSIRVDASDVTPGMFNDGEVETIPTEVAMHRKPYIATGSTPEFDRHRDEIVSLMRQLSGISEEGMIPNNGLSSHSTSSANNEKCMENNSSGRTNTRDSSGNRNISRRSSEDEKCNEDKDNGNNNNDDNNIYCCVNSPFTETSLRNGWVWSVMQERHDQRSFSPNRMRVWKALGKLIGVKVAVRYFTSVVRLQLRDFIDLTRSNAAAAKESPQWLFACLADMLSATIRMSKRDADARCVALTSYTETLLFACTSSLVPNEACNAFLSGIVSLQSALHPDEVSSLYQALFTALRTSTSSRGKNAHKIACPDGSNSNNNNNNNNNSACNSDSDVDGDAMSEEEGHACRGAHAATLCGAAKTQKMSRVLSAILFLLSAFSREVNVILFPQLSQLVLSNKSIFLHNGSTNIRRFAASVLRQIMCLSLQHSDCAPANASVLSGVAAFVDVLERAVDRLPLPPPGPRAALAPWGDTPALCAAAGPALPAAYLPAAYLPVPQGPVEDEDRDRERERGRDPSVPGLRLEPGLDSADAAAGLAAVKTLAMCWYTPPPALLEARIRSVVALLAQALDIALPEMDDLYETVRVTLVSIARVRLPKQTVHSTVEMLCDILGGKMPYGTSRHAKSILCEMLRLMIFTNLHRIGKFVIMQSIAEAALQCIGHGDGRVRHEGKLLLSVLTRVASAEQTQALVQGFFRELRELPAAAAIGPSPSSSPALVPAGETVHRRRRIALILALCSIAAASPGSVPVYGPRLMERLVPYANDLAQEVHRTVRQTFGEWWRSHREGWELEYKPFFTEAQIEVISPLLTASTYLV